MITDSKEVGLAIAQILGSELFGFEDLHYGYWTPDLPISLKNFARAQENYSDEILESIPTGVRRVLDVGAGSGMQAERLLKKGYQVDCVSPSAYLAKKIQERLGSQVHVYPLPIEQCTFTTHYDLVLFSESFQYVNMKSALAVAVKSLSPGGYILISDFFRRASGPEGPLGGGHLWSEFQTILADFPLSCLRDRDITNETAPTMGMFGELLDFTARPVKDLICHFIEHRHPSLYKFLAWKFRERFHKIQGKYFSGQLSTENFCRYKTYHLMLYRLGSL